MLDVATGPAGIALAVADRTGANVAGVDLNEPMLRAGLARAPAARPRGRVRVAAGTADQLPFADATFDAVTFSYLLRYVDDPAATVAEMARVPAPRRHAGEPGVHACRRSRAGRRPGGATPGWRCRCARRPHRRAAPGTGWAGSSGRASPATTGGTPWTTHVAAWQAAGLTDVGTELMSLGGGLVMWGRKAAGSGS